MFANTDTIFISEQQDKGILHVCFATKPWAHVIKYNHFINREKEKVTLV